MNRELDRFCPIFEVVESGYIVAALPGDIVEGTIADDGRLHFYSAAGDNPSWRCYSPSDLWSTTSEVLKVKARLRPLTAAARRMYRVSIHP